MKHFYLETGGGGKSRHHKSMAIHNGPLYPTWIQAESTADLLIIHATLVIKIKLANFKSDNISERLLGCVIFIVAWAVHASLPCVVDPVLSTVFGE